MSHLYHSFQPLLTNSGQQRFSITAQQIPAANRLAGIVHSYLQINAHQPTLYPIIPDGMLAVFISADSIKVGGTQPQSLDIKIQQPGDYFGIRFYPGALRHFFKLNLAEITGQFVDRHYFPCDDFAYLNEEIYQHNDFHTRA